MTDLICEGVCNKKNMQLKKFNIKYDDLLKLYREVKGDVLWMCKANIMFLQCLMNAPSEGDEECEEPTPQQQMQWEYITILIGSVQTANRANRWRQYTLKEDFIINEVSAEAALYRNMTEGHQQALVNILRKDITGDDWAELEDRKLQRKMSDLFALSKLLGCTCEDFFTHRCICPSNHHMFEHVWQSCFSCKIKKKVRLNNDFWEDHLELQRLFAIKQARKHLYRERDAIVFDFFADLIYVDWTCYYTGMTDLFVKINTVFKNEGNRHNFWWHEVNDMSSDIVVRDQNYITQFVSICVGFKYKMTLMVIDTKDGNKMYEDVNFRINEIM